MGPRMASAPCSSHQRHRNGNKLTVTDETSGSHRYEQPLRHSDRLCTSTDPASLRSAGSGQGRQDQVTADQPPTGASLGIGFNSSLSFLCDNATSTVGQTPLVNINPRYEATQIAAIAVTLTYKKSATGNGPASSYGVCFRKDDVTTWSTLSECAAGAPWLRASCRASA